MNLLQIHSDYISRLFRTVRNQSKRLHVIPNWFKNTLWWYLLFLPLPQRTKYKPIVRPVMLMWFNVSIVFPSFGSPGPNRHLALNGYVNPLPMFDWQANSSIGPYNDLWAACVYARRISVCIVVPSGTSYCHSYRVPKYVSGVRLRSAGAGVVVRSVDILHVGHHEELFLSWLPCVDYFPLLSCLVASGA